MLILIFNESSYIFLYYVLPFLISFGLLYTIYMMRNNTFWKDRNVPFINPKPFFGNTYEVFTYKKTLGMFFRDIYEKYKEPFIGIFIFDQPCLIINDLEIIKHILVKDFEYFKDRTMASNIKYDPVGSRILFFSKYPFWEKQRKIVSPLFSPGKLKLQTDDLMKIGKKLKDVIEFESSNNDFIDVKNLINRYSLNTITSVFYGIEDDELNPEQEKNNSPFLNISKKILNWQEIWHAIHILYLHIAPKFAEFFHFNVLDGKTTKFFKDLTWDLLQKREEFGGKTSDLIHILLEKKKEGNIKDTDSTEIAILSSHLCQMFVTYEIMSSSICFTLFELAKNQECQDLARKEIFEIWEKSREFSIDNINLVKYLKNCYLETLRMYPINPFLDRRTTKKYQIPGTNLILEEGQAVYIPIWGIHHDPKYYSNPLQFDPNRFRDENIKERPEYAYLPFGKGRRNCPGERFSILSACICLAQILLNYKVKLPKDAPENVEFNKWGYLLQPKNGLYLQFIEMKK